MNIEKSLLFYKRIIWLGLKLTLCDNSDNLNPIWTGLFADLKSLWGTNLVISSQKTVKLGKGILWVEIFTN